MHGVGKHGVFMNRAPVWIAEPVYRADFFSRNTDVLLPNLINGFSTRESGSQLDPPCMEGSATWKDGS